MVEVIEVIQDEASIWMVLWLTSSITSHAVPPSWVTEQAFKLRIEKSLTSGEAHIYSAAHNQVRTSIPQLSVKTYGRTNFHELHTVPQGSKDPNNSVSGPKLLMLVGLHALLFGSWDP